MSRLQLALNVNDIDAAVDFYTTLFDTEPAKRRPGYANFAIENPALKLILFENPEQTGTLNHLGVERMSMDEVEAEANRLEAAGLTSTSRATWCAATPARTSTGSPAPTGRSGRTTSSSPTPTPSSRARPPSTAMRRRWRCATTPSPPTAAAAQAATTRPTPAAPGGVCCS